MMERRGQLKNWNDQKGFGFIQPEQGGETVFAHISAMRGDRRPVAGDQVLYLASRNATGRWRAEHIRLDAPLSLDEPHIRRKSKLTPKSLAPAQRRPSTGKIQAPGLKLLLWCLLCAAPLSGALGLQLWHGIGWPVLGYGLVSLLSCYLYWSDKRSAQRGAWRIPEKTLHTVDLLGGWPGGLLAQQLLRHKTRKTSFQVAFWLSVILHQLFWIDWHLQGRWLRDVTLGLIPY
jgi:uncharacterized membrane protein YsdA (DUF1294 family)/cold shock CspA family protein